MIYLASPYTSYLPSPEARLEEQALRYRAVRDLVLELTTAGEVVFSPILYCHELALSGNLPGDAGYWKRFNRQFIRRADLMMVYKLYGWKQSLGIEDEIAVAGDLDITVSFVEPPQCG